MARFIHTADWQLGLKLRFIPGDRGARARLQRFESLGRVAELAHEHHVDAVVVAGDVFDDNDVGPDSVQLARDMLKRFGEIPVLLLPGNHDALRASGALARLAPGEHGLDAVQVLDSSEPVTVGELSFFPCPLTQRHSQRDPTTDLPARAPGEGIRVAVAHGGVFEFGESDPTPDLIDVDRVLARGFDYLALGDYHGTLRIRPRAAYPGTPEATRFKEKDPGNVLLVDIAAPGETPDVQTLPVARTRWLRWTEDLDGEADVEALKQRLDEVDERSWTALRLTLRGQLPLADRRQLDELLARHGDELLLLRVNDDGLSTSVSDAELKAMDAPGFLGEALRALRAAPDDGADEALRLLCSLLAREAS